MNILAIDIETMPNPDMISKLPEVVADSRLKDEEKIKADIEKKKAEQIEKMALSPLYGKIACIGYYGNGFKNVDILEEKEMLEILMSLIKNDEDILFTWNGNNFDWDFIIKRGIILAVDGYTLRLLESIKSRRRENFIDLMEKWCGYGKFAKLNEVASILLDGECKDDLDVKQIPELMKTTTGKEMIRRYCLRDCELTYKLARKMGY